MAGAESPGRLRLWQQALSSRAVWRRALIVGSTAGFLQICLHEGNIVLRDGLSLELLAKSALSPLIGVMVALAAATWVYVEREQERNSPPPESC